MESPNSDNFYGASTYRQFEPKSGLKVEAGSIKPTRVKEKDVTKLLREGLAPIKQHPDGYAMTQKKKLKSKKFIAPDSD